jgi:hypothetical protein
MFRGAAGGAALGAVGGAIGGDAGEGAAIGSLARVSGKLILQRVQGTHGWTLIIAEDTGQMSATIASPAAGYIIFGACTQLSPGGVQGQ